MTRRSAGSRVLSSLAIAILLAGCGASASPTPAPATPTAAPSPSGSTAQATGQPADDGARVVKETTVDARIRDLTIDSPSVGTVQVRLLLPSGFEAQPSTRWPVLYLLVGGSGTYDEWTSHTDVEALTAPTNLLVVMAEADDGWYSDWWNGGQAGRPKWETFHLVELRQLIERNWHAGDKRVVAGASMGGYGAMEYAARQPGMFLAAASYSGGLDPLGGGAWDKGFVQTADVWGNPVAQADIWRAHDPTDNASTLKGTALYVAYGNGQPGPLDASGASADDIESWAAAMNETFIAKLAELKIPVTIDAYGPGTHTWPYWQRDLHNSLPFLLKALGE